MNNETKNERNSNSMQVFLGDMLVIDNSAYQVLASIGMSAWWIDDNGNVVDAIITSGHDVNVGDEVYCKGEFFGTVIMSVCNITLDFALVKKENPNLIVMKKFEDGTEYQWLGGVPAIDCEVLASGAINKSVTGTVFENRPFSSHSIETIDGKIEMLGLVACTGIDMQPGDSGGCVLHRVNGNQYSLSGIVVGGYSDLTVYVRYNVIKDYLVGRISNINIG